MRTTGRIRTLLQMIHLVAAAAPGVFVLQYVWSIVNGVTLAVTPIVLEKIFQLVLTSPVLPVGRLIGWGACLLGVYLLAEVSTGFAGYYGEIFFDLANKALCGRLNRKAGRIAAIAWEQPDFLNAVEKAYPAAGQMQTVVFKIMDLLCSYLPYFVIYGLYLAHAHPALPGMLVVIFLPVLLSQVLKGKLYGKLEDETAVLRRRKQYFAACMADRDYAKETRVYGLRGFFRARYQAAVEHYNRATIAAGTRAFRIDLAAACVNLLGYVAMVGLLLGLVLRGHIALAAFAAILGSVRKAHEQMEEMVQQQAGEFSVAWALAENYFRLMDAPEEARPDAAHEAIDRLTLTDVGFAYPDGTRALTGISLTARRGDCIAVVGENGSGKTTLAKLLTGVYAPTDGTITAPGALRAGSSHLFQQYNRYRMTVAENVALGDSTLQDPARIRWALDRAGLEETLTEDTLLGREFGGAELSGGQWQKLAIARAVYRRAEVLVLDEPTAAIDPAQESQLYDTFAACAAGKICFVITHRLGLVKICNRIVVLQGGELVDTGSHQELMARCGYYRTLWEAQAALYESH